MQESVTFFFNRKHLFNSTFFFKMCLILCQSCSGTGKFSVMRLNSFVPFPFSLAVSGISISSGTKM